MRQFAGILICIAALPLAFAFKTAPVPVQRKGVQTIIIDPGHGGKDQGARGSITTEAKICLSVSMKLGKVIEERFPNIKILYTRTTDIINEVLEQNTDRNETYVKKDNIAKQRQLGISVSANGQITKWWSGNLWSNLYNNRFEGIVNGDFVQVGATTFQGNISNQFKFKKT